MAASDWTMTNPIDHSLNSTWPDEIRNLKDLLKSRLILQDAEPTARTDGTAFAAGDLGSIWFDSNSSPDNIMYVLTATTPTWTPVSTEIITTLLASARTFLAVLAVSAADATITLTNTDEEDTDGGRQVRFIAKGEQSGGEATTLGYLEFSHEGASDDEKGQFILMLNDGDDADAPSKQAIGFQSTGKIDVANSLSVLDEDNMASDDAEVLATQQSIVAYAAFSAYTDEDSDSQTLAKSHAYEAATNGFVYAVATDLDAGEKVNGYVETATQYGIDSDPTSGGVLAGIQESSATGETHSIFFAVGKGEFFEITTEGSSTAIRWKSVGPLSKPVDQD